MSKKGLRDKVEIVYKDGTKASIYGVKCDNFEKVKQWVDDFNNGLKPEDLIVQDKDSKYLSDKNIESAEFIASEAVILW